MGAPRLECNLPPDDSHAPIQVGFDGLLARLDNIARAALCHVHEEMLVGFSDTVQDITKQSEQEEGACLSYHLPGIASVGLPAPAKPYEAAFAKPPDVNSAEMWL